MTAVLPQARPHVLHAGGGSAELDLLVADGAPAPRPVTPAPRPVTPAGARARGRIGHWLSVLALTYLLISAVGIIGDGFKTAAGGHAEQLFAFATNPFVGLVVGILATALVQSSSTVTAIIVGLVAGGVPVGIAIPMIMGANIGTTVTNTLVSLGYVGDKEEFRRAFSAATVHDWFNLLAVALFLPLEMATGFLARLTAPWAQSMVGGATVDTSGLDVLDAATAPMAAGAAAAAGLLAGDVARGVTMVVLGVGLMVMTIKVLGALLRTLMVGRASTVLQNSIGRGPLSGIGAGTVVTVLVQSSSVTTSLIVPFAASGAVPLRKVYPFLLGANIGTTVTALLASTVVAGPTAVFALQIALVHLLFNVFGVLVIYGLPALRDVPVVLAEKLAGAAGERRSVAVAWTVGMFLGVPAALVAVSTIL